MKTRKGLGKRGDTLVEVLICILIVSTVLTAAYITTNRSSLRVLDAQERAQALKIAQTQLEQIRQSSIQAEPNIFSRANDTPFCMVINGAGTEIVITDADEDECLQSRTGEPAAADEAPAYQVTANKTDCDTDLGLPAALQSACRSFVVRVEWDSVATKGRAFESLSYRLYQ